MDVFDALGKGEEACMFDFPSVVILCNLISLFDFRPRNFSFFYRTPFCIKPIGASIQRQLQLEKGKAENALRVSGI
jgi:hypothetical protein